VENLLENESKSAYKATVGNSTRLGLLDHAPVKAMAFGRFLGKQRTGEPVPIVANQRRG
jgi:hypothetical protein